jgi:hypothetical protein
MSNNEKKKENLPSVKNNQELVTITASQFLTDFSIPKIQKQLRKIDNIPAAIEIKTPSIASISKKFGEDFTQAYIEGWIVNLRDFLNVGKKMTDQQTQETAMMIMDLYYNITIVDINLIFRKAKLGQWGQIYDRLDGQIILSWFEKYFNERCRAYAERSMLEADKFKNDKYQRFSTQTKNKDHAGKLGAFIEKFKGESLRK